MNTLNLISLTLLIPFGWTMSEAAAAYPESMEQVNKAGEHGPKPNCIARQRHHPIPNVSTRTETNRPGAIAIHAPSETPLQDRGSRADTCRLDLDLIEIR